MLIVTVIMFNSLYMYTRFIIILNFQCYQINSRLWVNLVGWIVQTFQEDSCSLWNVNYWQIATVSLILYTLDTHTVHHCELQHIIHSYDYVLVKKLQIFDRFSADNSLVVTVILRRGCCIYTLSDWTLPLLLIHR